jgi:hypothetical protein
MSPEDYFKALKKKNKKNKELFWQEVLSGLAFDKLSQRYKFDCLRALTCEIPIMLLLSLQMAINFEWVPRRLRHITTGK